MHTWVMYSLGKGVPEDMSNAKKWLQLAATQGLEKAKELIEEIVEDEEVSVERENAEIATLEAKMVTFIDRATRIIYTTEENLFRVLDVTVYNSSSETDGAILT